MAVVQYTFTHKQYIQQHKQYIEQHIIDAKQYIQQHNSQLGRVRTVPRLCDVYPGICLTREEKARKNPSQVSRRVPVRTMKTEYTEQSIHNNKNT